MAGEATVLIGPGYVPQHRQALLASRLPQVGSVAPTGRDDLNYFARKTTGARAVNLKFLSV